MFDHVVFAASDCPASKAFFLAAEKPAFVAGHREQVEAFQRAALEAVARTTVSRTRTTARNTWQPFIGPDRHNIEVVCHESEG